MRPEELIVFDIRTLSLLPAALALEVHDFTILECWWVAPKGPVLSHTAEVAGRFHFLNDPDEAQEHFLKEQALLHPDAVCGLIACPATGDAPHISDEQILLLWQRIVSVIWFSFLGFDQSLQLPSGCRTTVNGGSAVLQWSQVPLGLHRRCRSVSLQVLEELEISRFAHAQGCYSSHFHR